MSDDGEPDPIFTTYYAFPVEGRRIGLMSCLICGAAIVVDDRDSATVHRRWHETEG